MDSSRRLSLGVLAASLAVSTTLLASPSGADTNLPVITITSTSESSTTITLNWTVTSPGNVLEWNAQTEAPGPPNYLVYAYASAARTITLTGLTPSTAYYIDLTALCSEPTFGSIAFAYATVTTDAPGVAPPPTTSTTTTTTLPPRESPKIVSLKATSTTVTIRWLPVMIPMDKYVITAALGSRVVRTTTATSSARTAIVRGLRPNTHYKILLTAVLEKGSTKNSSGVTTK